MLCWRIFIFRKKSSEFSITTVSPNRTIGPFRMQILVLPEWAEVYRLCFTQSHNRAFPYANSGIVGMSRSLGMVFYLFLSSESIFHSPVSINSQLIIFAFTSEKTNFVSYNTEHSPCFIALIGQGPHAYIPTEK